MDDMETRQAEEVARVNDTCASLLKLLRDDATSQKAMPALTAATKLIGIIYRDPTAYAKPRPLFEMEGAVGCNMRVLEKAARIVAGYGLIKLYVHAQRIQPTRFELVNVPPRAIP